MIPIFASRNISFGGIQGSAILLNTTGAAGGFVAVPEQLPVTMPVERECFFTAAEWAVDALKIALTDFNALHQFKLFFEIKCHD